MYNKKRNLSKKHGVPYTQTHTYVYICESESEVTQSCPTLGPHELWPTRLLHPWDFPGKNPGVGCHFLLQEISTQGLNLGLPHCRQTLYRLSHQGNLVLNRMGKTSDLFKKIRDIKGTLHAKMGSIKDRNGRDLPKRSRIY